MRFVLPMPPSVNHGYVVGQGRVYKSPALVAWEQEAALIVGQWTPPERTPLAVGIVLRLPLARLRRVDADGLCKFLVDQTVGKRRDAWVDKIVCLKESTTGPAEAVVTVVALKEEVA